MPKSFCSQLISCWPPWKILQIFGLVVTSFSLCNSDLKRISRNLIFVFLPEFKCVDNKIGLSGGNLHQAGEAEKWSVRVVLQINCYFGFVFQFSNHQIQTQLSFDNGQWRFIQWQKWSFGVFGLYMDSLKSYERTILVAKTWGAVASISSLYGCS